MKNMNTIIIAITVVVLLIGGAFYLSVGGIAGGGGPERGSGSFVATAPKVENVSIVDGKQIIEITAKGGYRPVHSIAKVGIPTILRINTNGTFDCSSSVRIPSMNISKNLPMFGTTDIDIGIQKEGILKGTCGMGMYPFDIKFE